jgi:hypothetical protein
MSKLWMVTNNLCQTGAEIRRYCVAIYQQLSQFEHRLLDKRDIRNAVLK